MRKTYLKNKTIEGKRGMKLEEKGQKGKNERESKTGKREVSKFYKKKLK